MASDPNLQPIGTDPGRVDGGATHLSDYWQVIARRTWLILLIFGVTTASAIWAASRQQIYFQSSLSLQVNDPQERMRNLVLPARISSMTMYVDPIQSEMEVLQSSTIAAEVVQALGLRLESTTPGVVRSALFRDVTLDPAVPEGGYELVYNAEGSEATLFTETGEPLGSARIGNVLDAGSIQFSLRIPLGDERTFPLRVFRVQDVSPQVRGGSPRSRG